MKTLSLSGRRPFIFASLVLILAASALGPATLGIESKAAAFQTTPCNDSSLVAGITWPLGIAADDSSIYFGDVAGNLYRVSKTGGPATTIASVPGAVITSVAADGDRIYFAAVQVNIAALRAVPASGLIASVSKSGGSITTLASSLEAPIGVVTDSTHVYWASIGTQNSIGFLNADGAVQRVAKSGGQVQTLASDLALPSISLGLDDTGVYFGENGGTLGAPSGSSGVRRVAKTGGPVVSLTDARPAFAVAVDGSSVYFASGFEGGVYGVAKQGGELVTYAENLASPRSLKVDGDTIYFAVDGNCGPSGGVYQVDTVTRELSILKGGLSCTLFIATDSCAVYAPDRQGSIERICKGLACPDSPEIGTGPVITSVRLKGKKLFVQGENFQIGSVIEINGSRQNTKNNELTPMNLLLGKKSGKNIATGVPVNLTVLNPDGTRSASFTFIRSN